MRGYWVACGSRRRFWLAGLDSGPWHRFVPHAERCLMGAPVDPAVSCRRRAIDGPWCKRHWVAK